MMPIKPGRRGFWTRMSPCARQEDQRGVSLLEFLIALVVLTLTVGGIAAATMTSGNAGKQANDTARLNVLSTAFGEAIKALPYTVCAEADDYQNLFDESETALPVPAEQLTGATLTVVDVPLGPDCPGLDSGIQTVSISVKIGDRERVREIVKRSPDPNAIPLNFEIEAERRSSPGDPLAVYAIKSTGTSRIFQYDWWCDGSWEPVNPRPDPIPDPDFSTFSANDPTVECQYTAPPTGSSDTFRIALRVYEDGTGRVGIKSRTFPLDTTPAPHNPPVAQITVNDGNPPQCLAAQKCLYNVPISFKSTGPPPVDASILQWKWNFGDGTPEVLCAATGPATDACINQTHTYAGGGEFLVTLVVIDNFGAASAEAVRNVTVQGPIVVRPTVSVTANLAGTPAYGISPQTVSFDARSAHADGVAPGAGSPPGGIANYFWDFGILIGGVAATQSGPNLSTVSYPYPATSTRAEYTIKVTVTDVNGLTNFATMQVVLDPLLPPINLRNSGAHKGDIPLFRNAYFDFQWVNVPRMPGDSISYQIKLNSIGSGGCSFFGIGLNRVFTVDGGAAGSVQSYRAQFSSSPRGFNGVCAIDTYAYTGRTVRSNANGTFYSAWTNPLPLYPEF